MSTIDRTRTRKPPPTETEAPGPVALPLLTLVLDTLDTAPAGLTITDLKQLIYHRTGKSYAAVVLARALVALIATREAERVPASSGPRGGREWERYRVTDPPPATETEGGVS